jgi:hypothetical protein
MVFAKAMRQASRYAVGTTPTARLNRSKNAERESAASIAALVGSPQSLSGRAQTDQARLAGSR